MKNKCAIGVVIFACFYATFCLEKIYAIDSNSPADQITLNPIQVVQVPSDENQLTYITDSTNTEPTYQNMSLGKWLQKYSSVNPGHLALSNLLTLKQVGGMDEYGNVHFELPVHFDALKTNDWIQGVVSLGSMDTDGDFAECEFNGFDSGTNGHCDLWWTTTYDPPGQHQIRAALIYNNGLDSIQVIGPAISFYSSNDVQFFESDSVFDEKRACLDAQLPETNATYVIKLYDPSTKPPTLMKTICDATTNGMIREDWNFKRAGDKRTFSGNTFYADFDVTFPDTNNCWLPRCHILNRLGSQP